MGIAPVLHPAQSDLVDPLKPRHPPTLLNNQLQDHASVPTANPTNCGFAAGERLAPLAAANPTANHSASVPKSISSCAHAWSGKILVGKTSLIDEHGRTLLVRGVNMSGNSKLPTFPLGSNRHTSENFYDHRNVSFIGRPFPLCEIEEHFERLHAWGLTFARLLVPWEALEHAGPGIYDEEYIDFLIKLLQRAPEYGIKCFIDPHQDTWSRYSGGSGAPGWTFEVAGLDLTKFIASGAVHYHDFTTDDDNGKMIWPTNYIKLASATMFTLFFGGDEFAPNLKYQNQSPQSFLQTHFCNAYAHLAKRFLAAGVDSVVGFEVINEPHPGYIGLHTLEHFDLMKDLHLANTPTPLQSFALGSGYTQSVDFFVKSWPWPTRKSGTRTLNIDKQSAWLPGRKCIWRDHGVWDIDTNGNPVTKKKHYFRTRRDGSPIDFNVHCYNPFIKKYSETIRSANPNMTILFEPIPNEDPPVFINDSSSLLKNTIYAPHWYDLKSVFNKSFNGLITHDVQSLSRGTKNVLQASYFGMGGANRNYRTQISNIVRSGNERVGPKPCLIGECGIPMDINEKAAFETGDYQHHTNFLDAVINAMESNLVNFTLWNYNPHNDNAFGDHWNGEDFSIYSRNARRMSLTPLTPFDITEICFNDVDEYGHAHAGGRALDAVIRPYAAKIAGTPLKMSFDLKTLTFELYFSTPIITTLPHNMTSTTCFMTEIYVPNFHYGGPTQPDVCISDGKYSYSRKRQTLYWKINPRQYIEPWFDETPYAYWKMLFPDALDHAICQAGSEVNIHSIRITPAKPLRSTKSSS
ncbi:hypothetical protein BATDEDRAFT_16853 [Batrachochytrium dendrobatidis JAM81]|uniref:Glycoside hydrolase family 5 domain-containing protein n=1 Tax=Batrachochytrium dendrobatidis (strain JAM81 / FGSC 10211) TaxID=684364 RepID=F4P486_BATDJ|nr:uncharacterized protein BATDEDRAFT_16853 [Batrachochytrium dendrobatidis JAM81]EGF79953.1 hypothetical protein BATDEDRAFT_16853 [Batrachochytrium dendrobatidis JAM81]|eukprot:XP_006679386.1 hypothetical protein BATDEDRAFT_16853 [Batrachochytrium dendrobatidis JAM81]